MKLVLIIMISFLSMGMSAHAQMPQNRHNKLKSALKYEMLCIESEALESATQALNSLCYQKYLGKSEPSKITVDKSFFCKETENKAYIVRGFCVNKI